MVLVLSPLLRLKSCQVDYTQAFPQAPLDDDVFMCIPQGWFYDPETQQLHPTSVKKPYNLYGHIIYRGFTGFLSRFYVFSL